MKRIVLLRHGESLWNKENRFTGWTDVDLSDKGIVEACKAGDMLKEAGFSFEAAYTSYLKRAVKTLNCVLDRLNEDWIPVEKSWRLNEKHYGILQGLNKRETADKYGEEQVHIWRRSYGVSPEPVKEDDPRYPGNDTRYAGVPEMELPRTESLKDAVMRVMPYWECVILPTLMHRDNLLVVAHGNSLREIVKHLKNISDTDISLLNLPTAVPYVFEFDERPVLVRDYFLGDQEEIRRRTEAGMYSELTTDHPIDLCRYQVANGYMGRVGLINSGGESHGESDLHDAVVTAVVNKRAGGMGLISGRKAFQKPMKDGVQLLNTIQDVYLDSSITIA